MMCLCSLLTAFIFLGYGWLVVLYPQRSSSIFILFAIALTAILNIVNYLLSDNKNACERNAALFMLASIVVNSATYLGLRSLSESNDSMYVFRILFACNLLLVSLVWAIERLTGGLVKICLYCLFTFSFSKEQVSRTIEKYSLEKHTVSSKQTPIVSAVMLIVVAICFCLLTSSVKVQAPAMFSLLLGLAVVGYNRKVKNVVKICFGEGLAIVIELLLLATTVGFVYTAYLQR